MDIASIIERVGGFVTASAPLLEELSGDLSDEVVVDWLPRLPRLRALWCWDGGRTAAGLGPSIARHCPRFASLAMYTWTAEADVGLGGFLQALPPNTLRTLRFFSASALREQAVTALATQAQSLESIDVGQLQDGKALLTALPTLGACERLTTLRVDCQPPVRLNDADDNLAQWLASCRSLRDLTLKHVTDAPAILAEYLRSGDVRLTRLEVQWADYDSPTQLTRFVFALTSLDTSLRILQLTTEPERIDTADLVQALCTLERLTELRLVETSDYFVTEEILQLCRTLPNLEELFISGWEVDDRVWREPHGFANLRALRRLDFHAFAAPTAAALTSYVKTLEAPGNAGMLLNVSMANPQRPLSEASQGSVGRLIEQRVGGRFEYALGRGTSVGASAESPGRFSSPVRAIRHLFGRVALHLVL